MFAVHKVLIFRFVSPRFSYLSRSFFLAPIRNPISVPIFQSLNFSPYCFTQRATFFHSIFLLFHSARVPVQICCVFDSFFCSCNIPPIMPFLFPTFFPQFSASHFLTSASRVPFCPGASRILLFFWMLHPFLFSVTFKTASISSVLLFCLFASSFRIKVWIRTTSLN